MKKTVTFNNVPHSHAIPLPPGAFLHGMHPPVFHANGSATITVEYEVPERKRYWKHEPGNCTLHFSRPFIRLPQIDGLDLPRKQLLFFLYAAVQGLAVGTLTMGLFGKVNWEAYLFVLVGCVYTVVYRRTLRRGIAQAFRDRIMQ